MDTAHTVCHSIKILPSDHDESVKFDKTEAHVHFSVLTPKAEISKRLAEIASAIITLTPYCHIPSFSISVDDHNSFPMLKEFKPSMNTPAAKEYLAKIEASLDR